MEDPAVETTALRCYLYGQLGKVAIVAMWWTGCTPLVLALLGDTSAVASTRVAFNIVMLILSLLAGAVVERNDMKGLLIATTVVRMVIWSVLCPLFWYLFKSGFVSALESYDALYATVILLFVLDAAAVAFSNVLDIDMGGMDILASTRNIPVDDDMRNKYNSIFELGLSLAFILISPGLAIFGWQMANHSTEWFGHYDPSVVQSGALVGVFMVGTFVFSVLSLFFYSWIPAAPAPVTEPEANESVAAQLGAAFSNISNAWKIIVKHGPIFWRMLFFALELAVEDAFMIVIAPEISLNASWLGNLEPVKGALWTALVVAAGKLGGFLSAMLMTHYWQTPTRPSGYRSLFYLVLLGSAFMALMPLALHLGESDMHNAHIIGDVCLFGGSFFFFFFSTAPKIGFMTLFQSMVVNVDASATIFAWLTCLALVTDAVVIIAVSLIVQFFALKTALWIIAGIYLLHGLVECFIGPSLVLPNSDDEELSHERLLLDGDEA